MKVRVFILAVLCLGSRAFSQPCQGTSDVWFTYFVIPHYQCISVCQDSVTYVHVTTEAWPQCGSPIIMIEPGCNNGYCDETCTPANFAYNPADMIFDVATHTWITHFVAQSSGCVCVMQTGFLGNPHFLIDPANGLPQSACGTEYGICDVCIGPGLSPAEIPVVSVTSGCVYPDCGLYSCGGPATFHYTMTYYAPFTEYCIRMDFMQGGSGYCHCVTLESILPAKIDASSFVADAGDGMITLRWRTLSEQDMDAFRVIRSGELIATVNATNSPSGATYTYADREVVNGTSYTYTLNIVNQDNSVEETHLEVTAIPHAALVQDYALYPNYPNPFNPTTQISYDLTSAGTVDLRVFNLSGQEVAVLVDKAQDPGHHTAVLNGAGLASGLYFCTLNVNGFSATQKMLLVK